MSQATISSQPRGNHRDEVFLRSLDDVGRVLAGGVAGREREWAEEVGRGLACVEQGLRQHLARAHTPDGALAEVDDTRPSLVRQANELCREEDGLLEQCLALENELKWAATAFNPSTDAFAQTTAGPRETGAGSVPDFGTLRERVARFLEQIQKAQETEAGLVLESVNTDLGAGD